jgi:glucose-6-phosphate isomerase
MENFPFAFILPTPSLIPSAYDNHIERRLSALRGQFSDQAAYERMLAQEDTLLYEVYEIQRPHESGELLTGISIVHPGKVGSEFFMTKGHFHAVLDTAEVYLCMKGEGFMVMENPQGEWRVEKLAPGKVLYVPPRWAHRSVCTARLEDLVTFFIYPGHSGHDYGTIEQQGFRKLVVEGEAGIEIIDNPRWSNKVS